MVYVRHETHITDSSSLKLFRDRNAVYVDKTVQLHRLITSQTSWNYFIARPRRFGKSLMISTLEAIFKGRRELFGGTAIANLPDGVEPYDWQEYPVLRFDFSGITVETVAEFKANFAEYVRDVLTSAGCQYNEKISPGTNFGKSIEYLAGAKEKSVVILIDEYDAPVGHSLDDVDKAEQICDVLSDFYIQIKKKNAYVRFMMMTGVSKFTQLSVFSALNNLTDLTIKGETADLLGYSADDLEKYFGEHMRAHAEKMGVSYEVYREGLIEWSDGYRFSVDSDVHMYNPFAIANTLVEMAPTFRSTWSASGRPSFLRNYFNREAFLANDFENVVGMTGAIFDAADLRALQPETILLQAGYLTIKDVDENGYMTLGIPNKEVRQDFFSFILEMQTVGDGIKNRDQIGFSLKSHNFTLFEKLVKAFYVALPYRMVRARRKFGKTSFLMRVSSMRFCKAQVSICVQRIHSRADAPISSPRTKPVHMFSSSRLTNPRPKQWRRFMRRTMPRRIALAASPFSPLASISTPKLPT